MISSILWKVILFLVMLLTVDQSTRWIRYVAFGPETVLFTQFGSQLLPLLGLQPMEPIRLFAGGAQHRYFLPNFPHAWRDWQYLGGWIIRSHTTLTGIAWLAGALNLFFNQRPRKSKSGTRCSSLHVWTGRVFFYLGIPGVCMGSWIGLRDYAGLTSRVGFVGMGLSTLIHMVASLRFAQRKRIDAHKWYAGAAWWIGFFSAVVYRLWLAFMPAIMGIYDFNVHEHEAMYTQGYTMGAWASWAFPTLFFAARRAMMMIEDKKAK